MTHIINSRIFYIIIYLNKTKYYTLLCVFVEILVILQQKVYVKIQRIIPNILNWFNRKYLFILCFL